MQWKAPLLAALLTAVLISGCFGDDDDGSPGLRYVADGMNSPAADQPFATFLCRDGYRTDAHIADGAIDRCNHRVTKPLLDPDWFNVVDQHGPGNEVSIAVNPADPLNAAGGAKDYTVSYVSDDARCGAYTVWMGTYWTKDGGLTWGNDLMPGFQGDDRDSPLHGQHCNTDPVLVWDDDGTLWYQSLNYVGARDHDDSLGISNPLYPGSNNDLFTGSQIYFTRSEDGGETYGDFSFAVVGDGDQVFHDKQWFAVQPDGDHMIATWSMFTGTPPLPDEVPTVVSSNTAFGNDVVMYTESFDGGRTWSAAPLPFLPGTALPVGMQFSMPQYLRGAQADDGQPDIVVIWAEFIRSDVRGGLGVETTARIAYTEGFMTSFGEAGLPGTIFAPARTAFSFNPIQSMPGRDGTGPSHFRISTYPVLALDATGGDFDGRRYVVWADQAGPIDTDVEVLLRWSDDGASWSAPVTVNDVPAGDQYMPWIDVDPAGGVHVTWYDRRNDDTNERLDVYYAYSDDGGESFYRNVRVSETHFDGDLGHHQSGAPFIGDYIGMDTTEHSAHIIWADTRHTGVAGMGRPAGSDVYAATILRDAGPDVRSVFDGAFA